MLRAQVPRNDRPFQRPPIRRGNSSAKASFVSPTPSLEADDEESSSESDANDHEDLIVVMRQPPPQYDGDDTRLTSRKELAGWYSYGWAAEVFAVCALGSFLPITLEQLARDQGVLAKDKSTPCKPSWEMTGSGSVQVTDNGRNSPQTLECVVHILGRDINTASFAMYTFSISVLVQALLIISMSGAADHGRHRKALLLTFGFTGAVATMLFLSITPAVYVLGAVLAIIGNTCFGASFVLLNAFLPVLVRHHPSIVLASEDSQSEASATILAASESANEVDVGRVDVNVPFVETPLLPNDQPDHTMPLDSVPAALSPELKLSTKISSNGIGIGYIAAVLVQSLAILIVIATGSNTLSLRCVVFAIGLWWFGFTIPASLWLRPRPGPPLSNEERGWVAYFVYSWKTLGKTALQARRLKDVVLFLGAWFLLSDGLATVSGTAVLFAKTQLDMELAALGLINVIVTITGIVGAFSWSSISRFFNLRASHTIIACICLLELVPLYGLIGFIPAVKNYGAFGLQQAWEMYPVGAVYGFILGGLSSYCRSFFGELIPPGSEAAFFALYAITDKGSSVFGPAIVGLITDRYGDIRPAFAFLALLIFLPLPLMLLVNVDRGKADAIEMAAELEGKGVVDATRTLRAAVPTIHLVPDEDEEEGFLAG
ncbi:MAG: hypothetical protein Q9160_009022 [Pyrenula sp. 1 TL-2023]